MYFLMFLYFISQNTEMEKQSNIISNGLQSFMNKAGKLAEGGSLYF